MEYFSCVYVSPTLITSLLQYILRIETWQHDKIPLWCTCGNCLVQNNENIDVFEFDFEFICIIHIRAQIWFTYCMVCVLNLIHLFDIKNYLWIFSQIVVIWYSWIFVDKYFFYVLITCARLCTKILHADPHYSEKSQKWI